MSSERKRIVVSSRDDAGLESMVFGHFGETPVFTVLDVEDGKVVATESVPNPDAGQHRPGRLPVMVRDLGADALIAGGMGPRAGQILERFGILPYTGVQGKVRTVVDAYLRNELKPGVAGCPGGGHQHHGHQHHGQGQGTGCGQHGMTGV